MCDCRFWFERAMQTGKVSVYEKGCGGLVLCRHSLCYIPEDPSYIPEDHTYIQEEHIYIREECFHKPEDHSYKPENQC